MCDLIRGLGQAKLAHYHRLSTSTMTKYRPLVQLGGGVWEIEEDDDG